MDTIHRMKDKPHNRCIGGQSLESLYQPKLAAL